MAISGAEDLLAWAAKLARPNPSLTRIDKFHETLDPIDPHRLSWFTTYRLQAFGLAQFFRARPDLCWDKFTPEWWDQHAEEAVMQLADARAQIDELNSKATSVATSEEV